MTDAVPPLPWTARARRLRHDQTDCEALLWSRLRDRRLAGRKFHRQFAIGSYIVDFICHEARLIVEVDGGQHAERVQQDEERSRRLAEQGFRVLRFWNNEVTDNLAGVLWTIESALTQPSPKGRGCERSERVRGADSISAGPPESLSPHPGPLPVGEGEEAAQPSPHPGPLPVGEGGGCR